MGPCLRERGHSSTPSTRFRPATPRPPLRPAASPTHGALGTAPTPLTEAIRLADPVRANGNPGAISQPRFTQGFTANGPHNGGQPQSGRAGGDRTHDPGIMSP